MSFSEYSNRSQRLPLPDFYALRLRRENIHQSSRGFYRSKININRFLINMPDVKMRDLGIKDLIKRTSFIHHISGYSLLRHSLQYKNYKFNCLVLDDERASSFINYRNRLDISAEAPLSYLIKYSRLCHILNDFEELELVKKMLTLGADLFSIDSQGRNLLEQHVFVLKKHTLRMNINLPLITVLTSHGVCTSELEKSRRITPEIRQAITVGKGAMLKRVKVMKDQLSLSGVIQEISRIVSDYLYAPITPVIILERQIRNSNQITRVIPLSDESLPF